MNLTSAILTITWTRTCHVTFRGMRNLATGKHAPPTQADFDRYASGDIERPGDGAAWAKGLTGCVRWGVEP